MTPKQKLEINPQNLKIDDLIVITENEDQDLEDWYSTLDLEDGTIAPLKISAIELESQLIWAENCPFAIQISAVTKISNRGILLALAYEQIIKDVAMGDFTSIEQLLKDVSEEELSAFLPEQ